MTGIFARPQPVNSDPPIQPVNVTERHISDKILKEQVSVVRDSQIAFQNSIKAIENNSDPSTSQQLLEDAHQKQESLTKETFILKICYKLNGELEYARKRLDRARETGKNVQQCRKRVEYLEGRIDFMVNHFGKETISRTPSPQESEGPGLLDYTEIESTASEREADRLEKIKREEAEALALQQRKLEKRKALESSEDELAYSSSPASSKYSTPRSKDSARSKDSVRSDDSIRSKDSERSKQSKTEEPAEDNQDKREVFITEVADTAVELDDNEADAENDTDLGTDYWKSEHHRYHMNTHAQAIIDQDPLSYHTIGLALGGTFVQDPQPRSTSKLPWRPHRRGSDIQDVHKIALDKLATKLNKMSSKIRDAAYLSVDQSEESVPKKQMSNLLNSEETTMVVTREPTIVSKSHSNLNNDSIPKSSRKAPTELPPLNEMKMPIVFHPKRIPTPPKLPTARLNADIMCPPNPEKFTHGEDNERAVRIVNQRNLSEETKFTGSLYKPRRVPRNSSTLSEELLIRAMLEKDNDKTDSRKTSGIKERKKWNIKNMFNMAKMIGKLQPGEISEEGSEMSFSEGKNSWDDIKPMSGALDHSGLKWERVKDIIHNSLTSEHLDTRKEAAKSLGLLKCGDTMVLYSLHQSLMNDPDDTVRYESAKSLVLLGAWDSEVIKLFIRYLGLGNPEVRLDIIKTIGRGKNVQYIDKSMPFFSDLVHLLSHLSSHPSVKDEISFEASICLGRLCVADPCAKLRLFRTLRNEKSDTHSKAKALEALIRQMNTKDAESVQAVLQQLRHSFVWRHRADAAKLLVFLGHDNVCTDEKTTNKVFELLENRLWDDANSKVRLEVAKAVVALGMFSRACENAEKGCESPDEDTRSRSVISIGTLGIKRERVIRLLLEMLELDSSEYVRQMIIRTFGVLELNDKRVVRSLKEKAKQEGILGREASKVLKIINKMAA